MKISQISNKKWRGFPQGILLGFVCLIVAANASPFLPSSIRHPGPGRALSVRGGGFFGGKSSPPPASNFFDQVLAGAGEKVRTCRYSRREAVAADTAARGNKVDREMATARIAYIFAIFCSFKTLWRQELPLN